MSCPLAIYVYGIGARSETFIRRHIQELLPGHMLAVGRVIREPDQRDWDVKGPLLDLDTVKDLDSIKRLISEYGVQVMMGEYLDDSLPWLDIVQPLGIKFFGHAHGYDISQRLREAKWQTAYLRYSEAAGVITMSEASRARLLQLGLPSSKVHVVPYGVDVPEVPLQRPERHSVRLVAVGRMVAKKAPILTLDAFRRAVEVHDALHLDYIGAGSLLPAVQQFVRAFRLEHKVSLHGSQPNEIVQHMLQKADIFIQHSMTDPDSGDEEGFPVAILEAMAHALPVVSTQHAGIPESVVDGVTGYLVQEGDSETMAECIKVLVREPGQRREMGLAGWSRAQNFFSWARERTSLLNIFGLHGQYRPNLASTGGPD